MTAGDDDIYGEGAISYTVGRDGDQPDSTADDQRPATADRVRRHRLRRPRHDLPAGRRHQRARPAAPEDPDDDDRLGPWRRVRAPTRTAATTRSTATTAATCSSAAPATTWPTATSRTTWSSATTSSCCAASIEAAVPDATDYTGADRHHERALPDAVRRPDVQPHRPPERLRRHRHRRQQRPAPGRRRRRATTAIPTAPAHRHASVVGRVPRLLRPELRRPRRVPHLRRQQPASRALDSWGNDYLAGGAHNDLVFGQMGDDSSMGDGGIEDGRSGDFHVGASRSPDGCPATDLGGDNYTHGGTCDLVGDLDLSRRSTPSTDGQDYIEGNGGNDTVFGNHGQDDIVGGSSDFFSLTDAVPAARRRRPHLRRQRPAQPTATTTAARRSGLPVPLNRARPRRRHDRRRQRPDRPHRRHQRLRLPAPVRCGGPSPRPSTSRTSTTTPTASRSSSAASRCSTTRLAAPTSGPSCSASASTGRAATPAPRRRAAAAASCCRSAVGTNTWVVPAATARPPATTRSTASCGDDTDLRRRRPRHRATATPSDDDIVGGWGNDWISGGTGQDGILGDDGRIFTSRNSDQGYTAGTNTTGSRARVDGDELHRRRASAPASASRCTASPPSGRSAPAPRTTRSLCGDYLDQYIATPGEVQTAVINIGGDLKKTVDLTPYNLPAERHGRARSSTPTTPTT